MPSRRSTIVCRECGVTAENEGRGLCFRCYEKNRYRGTLDRYQKIPRSVWKEKLRDNINFLQASESEHLTMRQVVEDLGYTDRPESLAQYLYHWAQRIHQYASQGEV